MTNITKKTEKIKNLESPFTELFSLLKRYEILSQGLPMLVYETDELKVMHQQVNNAMEVLLRGLQDIGRLMGMVVLEKKELIEDLNSIGFFISSIGNLTEALNSLRSDADYVLKQRNEVDY